jgi:hypothetical protein
MARRPRNVMAAKRALGRMGMGATGRTRDATDLPGFNAPRTGKHTKLPRQKGGKGKGY